MTAISLRPSTPQDVPFLRSVYASTRAEELAVTGWSDAEMDAFLTMQSEAQERHYRSAYPDARFDVVLVDGIDAGRLYVHRGADEIRIIDIAMLPAWRGHGVSTLLLESLLDEARGSARLVSLHVEVGNPAAALYDRLGFHAVEQRGIHRLLHWHAASLQPEAAASPA